MWYYRHSFHRFTYWSILTGTVTTNSGMQFISHISFTWKYTLCRGHGFAFFGYGKVMENQCWKRGGTLIKADAVRMAVNGVLTSTKAADVTKLLVLKKCQVTRILSWSMAVSPPNRNPTPNVTWSGLPPKSDGFVCGPCATFPPNFV